MNRASRESGWRLAGFLELVRERERGGKGRGKRGSKRRDTYKPKQKRPGQGTGACEADSGEGELEPAEGGTGHGTWDMGDHKLAALELG